MARWQDLLLRLESRRRGRQVTVRRELVLAEDGGGPVVELLGLAILQTTFSIPWLSALLDICFIEMHSQSVAGSIFRYLKFYSIENCTWLILVPPLTTLEMVVISPLLLPAAITGTV